MRECADYGKGHREHVGYGRGCGCKLRESCVYPWVSYESIEDKCWADIVYSHFSEREIFTLDYKKCPTVYDYCFPEYLFDYTSSRFNLVLLNRK